MGDSLETDGFFSFNSEILSLSDTIKTNRGRRGMLSNRNPGSREPSTWASPRGQARGGGTGRGPGGGGGRGPAWDLRGGPGSTPVHPAGSHTGGRAAGESAPRCESALSPPPPCFRAPKGSVPGTPFLEGGRRPRPLRPSCSGCFSWQPGGVLPPLPHPHRSPRASIAPSAGRGRNKDWWKWEAGVPGTPANCSSDWLADVWPRGCDGAREGAWPAVPAPGAVPYLPGSCREGRRGSARIPGLNVLPLSPYPSIQLGLLPLASPWKKSLEEKKRKINHAAEKGQPRSAGGSSEPGGSVPLGRGRPAPPPLPARLSLALPPPGPLQCRRGPAAPAATRPAPSRSGFSAARGGWGGPAGRGPRRQGSDAGRGELGNPGPGVAGCAPAPGPPRQPRQRRSSAPGRPAERPPNPTCKYPTQVETALGDKPQDPFPTRLPSRSRHPHPLVHFSHSVVSPTQEAGKSASELSEGVGGGPLDLGGQRTSRLSPAETPGHPPRLDSQPPASPSSTSLLPGTCPGCTPELGACEPDGGGRTAATPEEVWIERSLRCAGPGLLGPPGQGHQSRSWEGIRVVTSLESVAYFSRRKMSPPQGCLGLAALLPLLGYLRDWQLSLRNIFWMECE